MNKWLLGIAAILLIVIVYYVVGSHLLKQATVLSRDQATGFALEELRYTYPNAGIDIYTVANISNTSGDSTWKIMARVVYGNRTVCPNLTEVELHYPTFGFVTRERIITENCHVLGCRNVPNCVIAYPEEAVLMPLDTDRNPSIQPSISTYFDAAGGRQNVGATAVYYSAYAGQGNNTYPDVWVVTYSSVAAGYSYEAILNKTGGIVVEQYAKGGA